jgi:hypothetical protein
LFVDRVYQSALLLAILGRNEEAVRLLRVRADRGFWGSPYMEQHAVFDLLGLGGYPPFEELIAPSG